MTQETPGMYAIADPDYPQVKIKDITICRQDDKSVWVQMDDGEGAQFSDESIYKALKKYYDDNF
jgi:hypothetical protein